MRFGAAKPVIWHKSTELNNKFNRTSMRFHKLMILENVWPVLVGAKAKFWVLKGVHFEGNNAALEISVKHPTALHDLKLSEAALLRDLNKYFEKPWIQKINFI